MSLPQHVIEQYLPEVKYAAALLEGHKMLVDGKCYVDRYEGIKAVENTSRAKWVEIIQSYKAGAAVNRSLHKVLNAVGHAGLCELVDVLQRK